MQTDVMQKWFDIALSHCLSDAQAGLWYVSVQHDDVTKKYTVRLSIPYSGRQLFEHFTEKEMADHRPSEVQFLAVISNRLYDRMRKEVHNGIRSTESFCSA